MINRKIINLKEVKNLNLNYYRNEEGTEIFAIEFYIQNKRFELNAVKLYSGYKGFTFSPDINIEFDELSTKTELLD